MRESGMWLETFILFASAVALWILAGRTGMPKPRGAQLNLVSSRRPIRFSLRELLVVTTVIAIVIAAVMALLRQEQ